MISGDLTGLVLGDYLQRAYRALTSYLLWRAAQEKPMPRRLTFVMDVSGSMYRFNGHDGRLNKMLETTCLVTSITKVSRLGIGFSCAARHSKYEVSAR